MTPIMTPSLGGFLTPMQPTLGTSSEMIKEVSPSFVPIKKQELLNKVSARGLKLEYRFTRTQHLASSAMVNVELILANEGIETIQDIHIGGKVCLIRQILTFFVGDKFIKLCTLYPARFADIIWKSLKNIDDAFRIFSYLNL